MYNLKSNFFVTGLYNLFIVFRWTKIGHFADVCSAESRETRVIIAQSPTSVFPAFSPHPRGSCVPHFEMIILTEDTLFYFCGKRI